MTVFKLLKDQLNERSWSMTDLARSAGVSKQVVSQWLAEDESLRVVPSPASCERIAGALGLDPDYVLELAGHRQPREPRAEIDVRRQAVRDQLDRWLSAVGPEYEEAFWRQLKNHGDSTVDLIRQIGTAVNEEGETAVNDAVGKRAKRGRTPRNTGKGPLTAAQHAPHAHLRRDLSSQPKRLAA